MTRSFAETHAARMTAGLPDLLAMRRAAFQGRFA
jgi:hypothetical protein